MLLIFSRWKPSSTGLFCYAKNEVVVEHSGSLNLPTVKSETVFKAVVQKELPCYNLMAVLMDPSSAIRGSKKCCTSSNWYGWWFMSPYSQCF